LNFCHKVKKFGFTVSIISFVFQAYRGKHCAITALLELQKNIAETIEEGFTVALCSVDHSAAFDMLRPKNNSSKTETVIFDKSISSVKSKEKLKSLGVTFQFNLKWSHHITRISPKLLMFEKIVKNMTTEQILKIATAQLYSLIYYATNPVWINCTLTADLRNRLRALH